MCILSGDLPPAHLLSGRKMFSETLGSDPGNNYNYLTIYFNNYKFLVR